MAKTCYLHIGTGKTGTTSIQSTCHHNAALLAQMGVLYPGDVTEHFLLSSLFMAQPRPVRTYAQTGKSLDVMMADVRALEKRIREEVAAHPDLDVLISSEEFFTLGQRGFDELLDFGFDLAPVVKVICYVRHPFGRVLSGLQQAVKMGHRTLDTFDPAVFHDSITDRLDRIERQCDEGCLILRRFEPDGLHRGDVVMDMFQTLGLSDAQMDQIEIQRTNESLSHEGVLLADALTRQFPAESGGWNEGRSLSAHRRFREIRGAKFALPDALTEQVLKISEDEAARLADRFGLTFAPPRPPRPGALWGEQSINDMAMLINDMALQIEGLRKKSKKQARNGQYRKRRIAELERKLANKRYFGLGRFLSKAPKSGGGAGGSNK